MGRGGGRGGGKMIKLILSHIRNTTRHTIRKALFVKNLKIALVNFSTNFLHRLVSDQNLRCKLLCYSLLMKYQCDTLGE